MRLAAGHPAVPIRLPFLSYESIMPGTGRPEESDL